MSEVRIVYFSSITENTKHFVEKLDFPLERIPLYPVEKFLNVDYDYVLFCPTYGDGNDTRIVPKQVIKFLNDENNRSHCVAVIAGGNLNFGEFYGRAGRVLSAKLQVPLLYLFELFGNDEDVRKVNEGLLDFWSKRELEK